jgi:hypothetical protein
LGPAPKEIALLLLLGAKREQGRPCRENPGFRSEPHKFSGLKISIKPPKNLKTSEKPLGKGFFILPIPQKILLEFRPEMSDVNRAVSGIAKTSVPGYNLGRDRLPAEDKFFSQDQLARRIIPPLRAVSYCGGAVAESMGARALAAEAGVLKCVWLYRVK